MNKGQSLALKLAVLIGLNIDWEKTLLCAIDG